MVFRNILMIWLVSHGQYISSISVCKLIVVNHSELLASDYSVV